MSKTDVLERKGLVIALCWLFFPLGLWMLWKSGAFSENQKRGITAAVAVTFLWVAWQSNQKPPPARPPSRQAAAKSQAPAASPPPSVAKTPPTATQPAPAEPEVVVPSKEDLKLDGQFYREQRKDPAGDPTARIAKRNHVSSKRVEEAWVRIVNYQNYLEDKIADSIGPFTGKLDPKYTDVAWSDMGPYTAKLGLVVIGCPEGGLPDKRLDFLARTALQHFAESMPEEIDGYIASIWYEGLRCSRTPMGYSATWTRKTNNLTLE